MGLVVPLGVGAATGAQAVQPDQAGFDITVSDAKYILAQIQIAEAHKTADNPRCTVGNGLTVANCGIPGTNPVVVGSVNPTDITDARLPYGLRQVDGRNNNLMTGFSQWNGIAYNNVTGTRSDVGAADRSFPRLTPQLWRQVPADLNFNTPAGSYALRATSLSDPQPRTISNLIVDQSAYNPAAAISGGVDTTGWTDAQKKATTVQLLNTAPAAVNAPPANGMFTLFGQFFDHGLDLVNKTSQQMVIIPLQPDDPLYVPGSPTNFMAENRTVMDANNNGINSTTPWIDQNQTYTSHPSHQVFLRGYGCNLPSNSAPGTVCTPASRPVATGGFLDGSAAAGNLASWDDVKLQAQNKLGIWLTDYDVTAVPLLMTDEYGRFLRGPNGFPLVVLANGNLREGDPTANGGKGIQLTDFTNPSGPIDLVRRAGHAFLDDIAHDSAPKWTYNGTAWVPAHNVVHLGQHFITGDGRGNENIGLSSIHTVFHAEHNRLVEQFKTLITANEAAVAADQTFAFSDWHVNNAQGSPWNSERLFLASRFVNEMEYQHLVFGEFARRVQPLVRPFVAYDPTLNPDIVAEFAHAVYRFGHSQLNETIDRTAANGTDNSLPLFSAFLSPEKFNKNYDGSTMPADQAVGQIARGMINQRASEIDEFVTPTLRNNLLGIPLDLATLNLTRGRDTGMGSLNDTRKVLGLRQYASWFDYGLALTHPASLVNFVAAYGTHPSITAAVTIAEKRAAADLLVNGGVGAPGDRVQFINAQGAWAPVNGVDATGLKDIDLWVGGLAEHRPPAPNAALLGETFDGVFKATMENLQEGDRFYYLGRLAGMNLANQIETNLFSNLIIRNSDTTALPGLVFDYPTLTIDQSKPAPNGVLVDANGWRYTGGANALWVGTAAADGQWSSSGDDSLRGNDANDVQQGGDGDDNIIAGAGDDVIDDTSGIDVLTGGPGNDYITSNGTGLDSYNGGSGQDFFVGGGFGTVQLGGLGDDFEYGGLGADTLSGDDGNDWLEGGASGDALSGDIIAPLGFDLTPPGYDVLSGDGGNNSDNMGGGSDVSVGGFPGTNVILGGLGFDWRTYYNPRAMGAATADLSLANPAPGNVQANLADTFLDTEALSGGDLNDTLIGDIRTTLAVAGTVGDNLNAADLPLFNGLNTLLGVDVNNVAVTTWNAGDILIGGNGTDTFTGQQGNDLIDGDAYLEVKLSVPNVPGITGTTTPDPADPTRVLIDSMLQVSDLVRAHTITTPQIRIVRSIKWGLHGAELDTAVYTGTRASYTLATGPGGLLRVTDTRQGGGNEGVDTLRNIERIQFADQTVNVSAPNAPRNVQATTGGVVSWTAPAANAGALYPITSYTARAWDAATGGTSRTCTTGNANTLTCTVNGLTAGRTYYFDVVANSAVGAGVIAPSPRLAQFINGTPAAPTNVVATPGSGSALVSWSSTAGPGAVVVYTARAFDAQVGGNQIGTCSGTDITSCTITNLTNASTYFVEVNAAKVGFGNATSAPRVSVTPTASVPTVPGDPGLVAGNGSLTATWTAPTNNGGSPIIGYTASAWTAATGGVVASSCTTQGAVSCTITGLPNGATYYVSVTAQNGTGTSPASNRVSGVPVSVPSKPAKPTVGPLNAGSINVGWQQPNNNGSAIIGYTASVYTVSSGGTPIAQCNWTTGPLSCTISGLPSDTVLYVGVVANNGAGSSPESTRAVVPVIPAAPALTSVVSSTLGQATATWVAPADSGSPITVYTVKAYTASVGGSVAGQCTTATLTCSITSGLSAGSTYYVAVSATNGVGTSPESARTMIALPTAPATPAAPSVSYPALGQLQASWTAPNNGGSAITGYTTKVYTVSSGGSAIATCATNSPCLFTGLTAGTTYYVGVTATNALGSSAESVRTSATLPNRPSRLPAPTVSYPAAGVLTTNFVAPASDGGTSVTGYQANVYDSPTAVSPIAFCTSLTATSCQVSRLQRGGTYYVSIVAINSVGASPYSARTTAVLPGPASAPQNFVVTARNMPTGGIHASWTAPASLGGSTLARYQVNYYTTATGGAPVAFCTSLARTWCDVSGLASGGTYYASVVAITAGGGQGYSTSRQPIKAA